jgi:PAS domain S-box-containing protein
LAAVESGLDWLIWVSEGGCVVDVNEALCNELGYSVKELIAFPHAPLGIAQDEDSWRATWHQLCLSDVTTFTTKLLCKSGASISVSARACYIPPSAIDKQCAIMRITPEVETPALRQEDAEIRKTEWMLPSFYEAMSEGVAFHRLIFDADGAPTDYVVLDVNSQYVEIVGRSRAEVIGKRATEVYHGPEVPFLDVYARVALTGVNESFQTYYPPLAKWLQISVTSFEKGYFATIFSDVTAATLHTAEREALLQDAQLKAAELDAAISSIPSGVIICDSRGKLVKINAEASNILGYTIDELPQQAADLRDFVDARMEDGHPLAADVFPFQNALNGREVQTLTATIVQKAGDRIWISYSSSPVIAPNGRILGAILSFNDITARKRSEGDRLRATALLERAQEIVRLGYWEYDRRAKTVWASEVASQIYGYEGELFTLEQVQEAVRPEYRKACDDAMAALVERNAPYDIEFQITRVSDGAVVDIRSRAEYHRDEQKIIGVIQDISARKASQATLQKLSLAVEQNPASIVITDPTGTIEYVNPKFSELTGYSQNEVVGKNPRVLKSGFSTPEMYEELWKTISGGSVWQGTLCNRKKNGDLYWESASISPIIDDRGRVTHYVAVKEDITQRVNADLELAALNERATKRLEYLQAAHRIELSIRKATELSELIPVILSEFGQALDMDATTLWTRPDAMAEYGVVSHQQRPDFEIVDCVGDYRRRMVNEAGIKLRPRFVHGDDCQVLSLSGQVQGYGILPLVAHGQVVAILEFQAARLITPDDEWWNCLEMIGTVCALALHNAKLFDEVRGARDEVVGAYDATLEGWSRALDLRDRETEGHSQRVTAASVALARRLGMSDEAVIHIRRGALLHDVGKLGVPDRILGKAGPLDPAEWQIMKMHPVYAYDWLSRIPFLEPALDIPRDHHEHWDGHGYPRGLKGNEIPLAARLFTIIDVWDALTHDRPYRSAWPQEKARAYLLDEAGKLVDARLLGIFLQMIDEGELS